MAVLKLEPTKAPNFAGTSYILQNAGRSLNRAFEGVSSLLGKYQEGAQEKVDNEIFSEIAGLDREGLQKYFESGKLKGRGMSGDMREFLGERMGNIADVNRTRGLIDSTADETSRLNAIAGRQATEAERVITNRQADEAGSVARADMIDQALLTGTGSPPVVRPGGGGVDGVGPVEAAVSRAPAHLINNESSGSFQATNESVGSGGIVGHDGRVQAGGARIQDAKNAGILPKGMTREEFRNSKPLQIAFENWHFDDIDKNIEKNGYSQYIGTKINGVTVTHAGMVDVQHLGGATGLKKFLESGGQYNKADDNGTTLTDYLQMGGTAAVAERVGPTGSTSAVDPIERAAGGETARDIGLASLRNTPGLSGNQRIARRAELRAAEAQGDATNKAAIEKIRVEEVATNLVAGISDPNITDEAALRNSVDASTAPGGTNVDKLATWKRVKEATLEFASILKPEQPLPNGVMAATTAAMGIQDNVLAALPQTYTYDMAKTFEGGPAAPRNGIVALLDLDTDPESPEDQFLFWGEDGKDLNILDKLIDEIATEAKVTHAVAAAAMVKHFVRNPTGSNLAKYRFQQDVTTQWLKDNMDPESMQMYESSRLSILAKRDEYKDDAKELTDWMILREKQRRNGTDTSAVDAKIERRTNTMLRGHTSSQSSLAKEVYKSPKRDGSVDALNRMPAGRARDAVAKTLAGWVKADNNLSASEKRLLLAEING